MPLLTNHKLKLVYLLAASHSGSTLLAMLLNAHPEVCTVGELKATSLGDPARYRCSCRKLIKECPFWKGIQEDMAKQGFNFDVTDAGTDLKSGASEYEKKLLRPLLRGRFFENMRDVALSLSPYWKKRLSIILARNKALIECIADRTGKRIIVDSSKIGLRLKYLLQIPELDVNVIRTVRDGRGVSLTYMNPALFADAKNYSLRQGGMGGNRDDESRTMIQAAREWRRSNEEGQQVLKLITPSQHTQISYEMLCHNPEETMEKLYRFIGVDPNKVDNNYRRVEHHVIGNGMRLDATSEISLDERWGTTLSEHNLRIFDAVAGKLNRSLGYQ